MLVRCEVESTAVHPWPSGATQNCDDGRVVGIGKREIGGADGGGWSSRPLESPSSLQRITHRQLMLRTSTARHRTRFVHVEEPVAVGMRWSCARGRQCCCPGPGPGLVLDEQRHSKAAGVQGPSERSVRAHRCAPSLTLTVQVARPRPESEDQGRGKVESSVCAYDLHAQATVEGFDQNPMPWKELVGSCSRRTR